jgi:ABC-type glycerol-3-phosphate transport system substrate-binding protein
VDQALITGTGASEARFLDYIAAALNRMRLEGVDALTALQGAEQDAVNALNAADTRKADLVLVVPTPVPTQAVASGEVAIKFGLATFVNPLPNQETWDEFIANFVANDPQVGRVDFEADQTAFTLEDAAAQYDCFYQSFNSVPGANLDLLLNLDPFLSTDFSFDQNDIVGGLMPQLQREGQTWGLPIVIEPSILRYNTEQFQRAGAIAPTTGWTVDQFGDALNALKITPDDPEPFAANSPGGTHLLILMAAYGYLPIDYRTNPPTIDYTSPESVAVQQQVLDLAKDGFIKYTALGSLTGGFGFGQQSNNNILTDTLNAINFRAAFGDGEDTSLDNYVTTTYPVGNVYSAASYTIGTAYISRTTQNPEACYRLISAISTTPDLFTAMPARRSLVNDPAVISAQGQDVVDLYNAYDVLLQDPNTVALPSLFDGNSSVAGFVLQFWLYQAWDEYVLRDGDLAAELAEKQVIAQAFLDCNALIPPFDPLIQTREEYLVQSLQCAADADPALAPIIRLIGGGD